MWALRFGLFQCCLNRINYRQPRYYGSANDWIATARNWRQLGISIFEVNFEVSPTVADVSTNGFTFHFHSVFISATATKYSWIFSTCRLSWYRDNRFRRSRRKWRNPSIWAGEQLHKAMGKRRRSTRTETVKLIKVGREPLEGVGWNFILWLWEKIISNVLRPDQCRLSITVAERIRTLN